MIAYFIDELFLGSVETPSRALPSYHFFCPSCGVVWARVIAEPGDFHRVEDTIWCKNCARSNEHGIWDGVIDVYCFPEYVDLAPKEVLIHNFMQLYDNRLRLDAAGVKVDSGVRDCPDYSGLLARLEDKT